MKKALLILAMIFVTVVSQAQTKPTFTLTPKQFGPWNHLMVAKYDTATSTYVDSLLFVMENNNPQIWGKTKIEFYSPLDLKSYINTDSSIYMHGADFIRYLIDSSSIHIGEMDNLNIKKYGCVTVGNSAGEENEGRNVTAIGNKALYRNGSGGNEGDYVIAIGAESGINNNQLDSALFITSGDTNTALIYGRNTAYKPRVQINGDLTVTGQLYTTIPHAFFSTEDTTYTPAVAQNVYTVLGFPGNKEIDHMTKAGDSLQITVAGSYYMQLEFTMQGGANNDFRMALFINGVKVKSSTITTTGAANYESAIVTWYADDMEIGDDITIRVTNLTNSDDPTLKSGSLFIYKAY